MNTRNNLRYTFISSLSFMLIACDEKIQTVNWYETHEKERQAMLSNCKKRLQNCRTNPAVILADVNCIHAYQAQTKTPSKMINKVSGVDVEPLKFEWDEKKGLITKDN